MHAATIADASDLAHARVLARSFHAHHPGGRFTVVRADDTAQADDELAAGALADVAALAAEYGAEGLRHALVPHVARHLGAVIVLSPRTRLTGPLPESRATALYAPGGDLDPGVTLWAQDAVAAATAAAWGDDLSRLPLEVDGLRVVREPLPLVRLEGLQPEALSAGRPQDAVPAGTAPRALLERHLAELAEEPPAGPRAWTHLRDDLPYSELLRALWRESGLPSPFTDVDAFLAYANGPAAEGAEAGVTRAVHALWRRREDLRAHFPQLDGPDGPGLVDWAAVHGGDDLPAPLRPAPSAAARALLAADWEGERVPPPFGANVAGFLGSGLGLGEAGRLTVAALDAARVPVAAVRARLAPAGAKAERALATVGPDEAPFPLNVLCMTGDSVELFAREAGESFFADRLTVGIWFWELASPPPAAWRAGFDRINELWATSRFVQEALTPTSPVPVHHVPLPIVERPVARRSRAELGLPEEGRLFLYVYDLHSVEARKNPSGLARAFAEAFEPGSGNVLVLKSANADRVPEAHARVLAAAGGHPDVHVVDRWVSAAERDAMVAACDCYVSPHRSEGFGLTIAEAMLLGRPVIATGYGGNADFTTDETAYVLPWTLRPVGPGAEPYPPDVLWADPDHDALVAALRHVAAHPDEAQAKADRARVHLLRAHAPEVAGQAMRERLEVLHARLVERGAHTLRPARAAALHPDAFRVEEPELAGRAGRHLEGPLRRLDQRVGRRVEQGVRALDERMRALVAELDRRRARDRAELQAEVRRLQARLDALEAEARCRPTRR